MSLVSAESGRIYSEADVALAEDVARRAATAIDNSHLHSETRDAALLLQKAVLPDALPVMHGWEMEVHYAPSGRTEVGGDFYDAIALADGRLAVLVGDVMGRGVQAAAAMAQMRAASRAYIAIDDDPTAVAQNLDRMFSKFKMGQIVTLVYLVADQERNEITIVNAGHLPPIIVRSDGQASLVESRSSAAFSIGPDDRTATRLSFGSGDTLLVYTDGLIERRSEAMPDSFARLLAHASALRSGDLSSQLSEMILAVHDEEREDDITALALRRV
jgi:serine phosphatase RsbU (regulator of sigma subunit)